MALTMVLGIVVCGMVGARAAVSVIVAENTNVRRKLDAIEADIKTKLPNSAIFSANGTICNASGSEHGCSNCRLSGMLPVLEGKNVDVDAWNKTKVSTNKATCWAFAAYVFVKAFDTAKNSKDTINIGKGNDPNTYKTFRTGDLFYSSSHCMIFLSSDSEGVTVLHGNRNGALGFGVNKLFYKHNNLSGNISVWQSPNWDKVANNITYTITYDANNGAGAPAAQTKAKDRTLTLSTTIPTRNGYNFLGWSPSKTATTASYSAGSSYTANASATLYAVWKAVATYVVKYDSRGGTAVGQQTKTQNVTLKLSTTVPTKNGYAFVGWGSSSTATTPINQPGGNYNGNAPYTYYAIWRANPTTTTRATTTTTTTSQSIYIVSATPNRTSGTTEDKYACTVTTNIPATRIEYVFSGNSTVYYLYSSGTNNLSAGGYSISADKKTWVWKDILLGAGNPRTVTVTAYNGNQKSLSKSFNIVVAAPSPATTTTTTKPATTTAPAIKPDVYYKVRYSGGWLPEVKNNTDYAGITGKSITDVAIRVSQGSVKYRVHVLGDSSSTWRYSWVTGYNTGDSNNGYAGNGTIIDAVEIIYTPPSGASQRLYYRVSPNNGAYYGTLSSGGGTTGGAAGAFGKSMDKLQLWF